MRPWSLGSCALQQRKPWLALLTPSQRLPLHRVCSRLRGEFSERRREAVEAVYEAKPMPQVGGGVVAGGVSQRLARPLVCGASRAVEGPATNYMQPFDTGTVPCSRLTPALFPPAQPALPGRITRCPSGRGQAGTWGCDHRNQSNVTEMMQCCSGLQLVADWAMLGC